MKKTQLIFFFIFALLISACSGIASLAPTATPVPTLTSTPLPTLTNTPTATLTATALPPSETPDVIGGLVPHGQPDNEWNGIPIMPDAIEGEGDSGGYRFTTRAAQEEIQSFYERELSKLGWQLLGTGEGDTGTLILIFMGDEGTVSVSILPNDDTSIVMIVK